MRPTSRIVPGAGQESVWDYPRPPRVEVTDRRIRVVLNQEVVAETQRALRVLETSHPPVYYIPPADVRLAFLQRTGRRSICEFKGMAASYTVTVGTRTEIDAAWSYDRPLPGYEALAGAIAFYPGRMDACFVDDEQAHAQEGDFYGGWITSAIVGPFKGAPGTRDW